MDLYSGPVVQEKDPLVLPFKEFNSCPAQLPLLRVFYREAIKGNSTGRGLGRLVKTQLVEAAARDAAYRDPYYVLDQKRTDREYFRLFQRLERAGWGSLIQGRRGHPTRFEFNKRFAASDLDRVFAAIGVDHGSSAELEQIRPSHGGAPAAAAQTRLGQAPRREEVIALLRAHTEEFRRLGVTVLSLFGSLARDEARADSDVDLLVAFDGPVTSDAFFRTKFLLEDLLGRRIDLLTEGALRDQVRREIEPELIRVA